MNRTGWTILASIAAVAAILVVVAVASDDDDTTTTAAAGATAQEIRVGQEALIVVGCYSGPIDGVAGPATEQAVRDYQAAAGLTVDGVFGPATLAALQDAVTAGQAVCTTDAGGGDGGGDGSSGQVKTARLTTSDGLDQTMDLTRCEAASETELTIEARTETSDLSLVVAGESSSVLYTSSEGNREGTVDSVSGTTTVTATGALSVADDSAEPATFELVADCS